MTRKSFHAKLISLIKPNTMSNAEYELRCAMHGIDTSVENPAFMSWVINEAYSEFNDKLHADVRNLLICGFKQHHMLDFCKDIDCSYVIDLIPDIILREQYAKVETEKLFRVILEEYRDTKLGEAVYHLNKGVGITETCYF